MREYEITDVAAGHFHHPTFGDIDFDFPELGSFTPRSEQDELVLEQFMIPAGFATATGDPPRQVSVGNRDAEVEAPTTDEVREYPPYPHDGSTQDVIAWVDGNPGRAVLARDSELGRTPRPRSGVMNALAELLGLEA